MRNRLNSFLSAVMLFLFLFFTGCSTKGSMDYGVFLGINGDEMDKLRGFKTVVIEPSEFQSDQIQALQEAGTSVYGYINIGAVEKYRPYFNQYREIMLSVYENWEDERWVDVSSPLWQDFIVNNLGRQYAKLGLDGFFLDNADVYYHYPNDEIYQGLIKILQGLKTYNIPLILNGGDIFVSRCLEEGIAMSLIDGINQETVFTSIDYDHGRYGKRSEEETAYFQDYLSKVRSAGLSVFLLEYRADKSIYKTIDAYCKENGFRWYNAPDLELR
ncbi:MAG: endo alpha-1,4 polygalactosaminidase [Anaerolineaceae bacterium]